MNKVSLMQSTAESIVRPVAPQQNPWIATMPWFFVLIWSTGFIVAKFGLPYAPPLTFLLLRFAGVICILGPLVWAMKAPWSRRPDSPYCVGRGVVASRVPGRVWCAIKLGMPAGISALIVGMQPILTAVAAPLIGESLRPRQWLGLLIGLCGVALVVSNKMHLNGLSPASLALCLLALISITAGTLYQKRYCAHFDLRTGTLIQFVASTVVVLPLAVAFEQLDPTLSHSELNLRFIFALSWSVLALSIGAIFLLFALIRKSAATKVTSLLYLTPPTTAVMAWLAFGETLGIGGIIGMMAAVTGVVFVVRR